MKLSKTSAVVLLFLILLPVVLNFECPKPKRRRRLRPQRRLSYHRHETHCDKYYVCYKNESKLETCPDGMIFNFKNVYYGRKCVLPQEGDCGGLTEFQPAQPIGPCKRQNGFFINEEDTQCRKYYSCTDGEATELECSKGTAFAVKSGNCDWPDNVKTCNLTKLYGFTCPKNLLVLVLKHGPNIKFPDPKDCRMFFTCNSKGKPRLLGCPLGRVFSDETQLCSDPADVPNCEDYYKSSEEDDAKDSYEYYDGEEDYFDDDYDSDEDKKKDSGEDRGKGKKTGRNKGRSKRRSS